MAPTTDVERALVEMWEEATGVRPVGIDDDFFELGGDSLRALQLASRISSQYGVNLMTTTPFSQSTVRSLAQTIEDDLQRKLESLSDDQVRRMLGRA